MAKRIIMIPPFEVLTGNLSGKQMLKYAENDNPAYEAPNGSQGARNYTARYVGTKRSDGKTFFSVRRKNTAVLNGNTRMQMALIGSIAAIKSALKTNGTLATIKSGYEYVKAHGMIEASVSFNKWVDAYLRDMLRYKRVSWSFTQASISFTVNNPYNLGSASSLSIALSVWVKFAPVLGFDGNQPSTVVCAFFIDSKQFVGITEAWSMNVPTAADNPNWKASLNGIASSAGSGVTYQGLPVYLGSVAQEPSDTIVADAKYATVQA